MQQQPILTSKLTETLILFQSSPLVWRQDANEPHHPKPGLKRWIHCFGRCNWQQPNLWNHWYWLDIPFEIHGITIFYTTRTPTMWGMESCRSIEMKDSNPWILHKVNLVSSIYSNPLHDRKINKSCLHISKLELYNTDTFVRWTINTVSLSYIGSNDWHSKITPENVARKQKCRIQTAHTTLIATTQCGIRQTMHPLHWLYWVDHLQLTCKGLNDTFRMDTLLSKVKSLHGNTCAQLITNGNFSCLELYWLFQINFRLKNLMSSCYVNIDFRTASWIALIHSGCAGSWYAVNRLLHANIRRIERNPTLQWCMHTFTVFQDFVVGTACSTFHPFLLRIK